MTTFLEKEIPYGKLEKFGLTKEMMDDLPRTVIKKLLSGAWTPVLPVVVENEKKEKTKAYARIAMVRLADNTVDVKFAPYCGFASLDDYSPEQQKTLQEGGVIIVPQKKDGTEEVCYLELDEALGQVMYVPARIIIQNIEVMVNEGLITEDQAKRLNNAELVTIEDTATIGIDLLEQDGVRIVNGDAEDWREERKFATEMPKYNFAEHGCWMTESDGKMNYVAEEQYTEEMKKYQVQKGLQRAASIHF